MSGQWPPLHAAVLQGSLQAVVQIIQQHDGIQYLLINTGASGGTTPLHCAAFVGSVEICDLLIQHGGNPCAPDVDGDQPLHCAAAKGFPLICSMLIQSGADANAVNSTGNTPLHLAASKDCADVVGVLLNAGSNPQQPNRDGHTPIQLAERAKEAVSRNVSPAGTPATSTVEVVPPRDLPGVPEGDAPTDAQHATLDAKKAQVEAMMAKMEAARETLKIQLKEIHDGKDHLLRVTSSESPLMDELKLLRKELAVERETGAMMKRRIQELEAALERKTSVERQVNSENELDKVELAAARAELTALANEVTLKRTDMEAEAKLLEQTKCVVTEQQMRVEMEARELESQRIVINEAKKTFEIAVQNVQSEQLALAEARKEHCRLERELQIARADVMVREAGANAKMIRVDNEIKASALDASPRDESAVGDASESALKGLSTATVRRLGSKKSVGGMRVQVPSQEPAKVVDGSDSDEEVEVVTDDVISQLTRSPSRVLRRSVSGKLVRAIGGRVDGHVVMKPSWKKPFALWEMTVQYEDGSEEAIRRRFSDFLALFKRIKACDPEFGFPNFPKKQLSAFSPAVIQSRHESFNDFVQKVLKDDNACRLKETALFFSKTKQDAEEVSSLIDGLTVEGKEE